MPGVQAFLKTKTGKYVAIVGTTLALIVAAFAFRSFLKSDTPDSTFYRTYICSETGRSFRHRNVDGETIPILSPYSGKETGYPAEACYWNADGTIKEEPTWVLLNSVVDKPEPTFCPDCGRLVVGHNPHPGPDSKPPPTQAEYAARHSH